MPKYLYAFDLSMECVGLVIFDLDTFEPVLVTSISPDKKRKTHGLRLNYIRSEITRIGKEYTPHDVAIERGISRFNTATQVIFRVHGIVNELFHNYPQSYYPPKTVKAALVGGDATKKMVQEAIKIKYPDIKFANEDESDAFATGITHMVSNYNVPWDKPEKPVKPKKTRKKAVSKIKAE